MKAYHFVGDTLRDGSPVPDDGVKLVYDGEIKLCNTGYHASLHPFDALKYAPGNTLCLVECGGEIIHGDDKLVCAERTIIKRIDAEPLLRDFARWCALKVVHLWDAPDVVVEYLKTGNESLRADARDAARDAARAAAWAAACDAAWAAARAAARAAWDASRDAEDASRDAHRDEFERIVKKAFGE